MAACADELAMTPDQITGRFVWLAGGAPPLGCACLELGSNDNTGSINSFFIAPEAQRKGVGRALWQVILTQANTLALDRLILDADPDAVPFYEAIGFHTFNTVPSGSIAGRMLPQMEYFLSRRP